MTLCPEKRNKLRFVLLTIIASYVAAFGQNGSRPQFVLAGKSRKALLIGNSHYVSLPRIVTALNDVQAVKSALENAGFQTTVLNEHQDQELQKDAIDEFASEANNSDVALVYFTGYANQAGDGEFLLPLNFRPIIGAKPEDIASSGYGIARLLQGLKGALARIIILDVRESSSDVEGPRGIVLPPEAEKTAIMFSTKPGLSRPEQSAVETTSIFAQKFAAAFNRPCPTIQEVFDEVQDSVEAATGRMQQPYSDIVGLKNLGFHACPAPALPLAPPVPVPGPHPHSQDRQVYVWIPPGEFMMGCSTGDTSCKPDENPPHSVRISKGFWIGKTEVTVTAYVDHFVPDSKTPKPKPPTENQGWKNSSMPIVNVNWSSADRFCKWIGGRLPTEAEWEYAARAHATTPYPWGDSIDKSKARYMHTLQGKKTGEDPYEATAPVGQYVENAWELLDVVGNVREWCNDWYDLYDVGLTNDPKGAANGTKKVLRGGSWNDKDTALRLSRRSSREPREFDNQTGFRCVIDNWPK